MCFPVLSLNIGVGTFVVPGLKVSLLGLEITQLSIKANGLIRIDIGVNPSQLLIKISFFAENAVEFGIVCFCPADTLNITRLSICLGSSVGFLCKAIHALGNGFLLGSTCLEHILSNLAGLEESTNGVANSIQGATFKNRLNTVQPWVVVWISSKAKPHAVPQLFRYKALNGGTKVTVLGVRKDEVSNGTRNQVLGDDALTFGCPPLGTLEAFRNRAFSNVPNATKTLTNLTGGDHEAGDLSSKFTKVGLRGYPKVPSSTNVLVLILVTVDRNIQSSLSGDVQKTFRCGNDGFNRHPKEI